MTDQEACPFCKGRGVRALPPAPGEIGRGQRTGRRHGYESTYTAGCRCELCTAARREGAKRRRREAKEAGR